MSLHFIRVAILWDAVFLPTYFFFTYFTCIILFTDISVSYNITNILEWTYNNNWRVILPVELYTPPGRPSFAPCIHWQQPWRKSTFAPIPLQNTKRANPLSWRVRNQSQQSYRVFSVLWLFYASLHMVTTICQSMGVGVKVV